MRTSTAVAVAFTGVVAGLTGAIAAGHFQAPPAAPATPRTAPPRPAAAIVPPGWDSSLLARLSHDEQQIADLQNRDPRPAADPPHPVTEREQERRQHYQTELAFREQFIADHGREPADAAWAPPQAHRVEQAMAAAHHRVVDVDCKTKTCVATLEFPTPGDGLAFIRHEAIPVDGCSALTMVPTPPSDAGPYQLSLLYTCR